MNLYPPALAKIQPLTTEFLATTDALILETMLIDLQRIVNVDGVPFSGTELQHFKVLHGIQRAREELDYGLEQFQDYMRFIIASLDHVGNILDSQLDQTNHPALFNEICRLERYLRRIMVIIGPAEADSISFVERFAIESHRLRVLLNRPCWWPFLAIPFSKEVQSLVSDFEILRNAILGNFFPSFTTSSAKNSIDQGGALEDVDDDYNSDEQDGGGEEDDDDSIFYGDEEEALGVHDVDATLFPDPYSGTAEYHDDDM